LPISRHRALAFSRLLLFHTIEMTFRGRYGLSRLTIFFLRLDHECGLRRRDRGCRRRRRRGGEGRRENRGGEKQGEGAMDESPAGGAQPNPL